MLKTKVNEINLFFYVNPNKYQYLYLNIRKQDDDGLEPTIKCR